ncbi:MAG TPA: hydantoinase B/oxoprolinase family protein, partial [Solirubrobacterales bacterium]|nr:hydantoinase B/oxoprolinase family protein [Solirubrobacterales bacterium]
REFALMPFGGAGPMHAAALANELDIRRILCPRASGVLSALGLIASDRRRDTARTVMLSSDELTTDRIAHELDRLRASLGESLEGAREEATFELRYRGQAFELPVPGPLRPDPAELAESFASEHERRYGYRDPDADVELVTVRLATIVPGPGPRPEAAPAGKLDRGTRRARFGSDWAEAEILRGQPPAGLEAEGPCIFELPEATLVLPPGWSAIVDDAGTVAANREERRPARSRAKRLHLARNDSLDPVTLQVLVGALRAACDEMGAVLIRSAHSPNITERHDCSTALFDPAGELVMQAEHIPVHLGSMPDAVGAVVEERHRPGDLWILNDPYRGGTHLPDVTLISPLFAGDGGDGDLVGFAASRAHHADIGGPTPGGMPADSTTLEEEGVVIPPTRATDDLLAELATRMRNPPQRLADLRAQRAANLVGARRMQELLDRYGLERSRVGLAEILDYAERRTRAALECLPDGRYEAEDVLEDDARGTNITLRVAAVIEGDRLTLDFAGTDAQGPGNLNCPLSVTKSAVFFAVRVLTDPDAPPSAGAHRPVDVVAPEGCVLRARPPAAVAGGNVETSSRVADLVLEALGNATPTPAHGQGTMNNLTLAGDGFTYYETIGGGQGGCPHADGPSAIHVAMSNTLNTPVEAFETEFPFRVRELSVRRGSGGAGRHPGGDGTIRELEALAPARLNLITERRRHAPRGRAGGENGAPGRNLVNGEQVPSKTGHDLRPGDRVRIETPGGGGYGTAPE